MLEITIQLVAAILYGLPLSVIIYTIIRWVQKWREPYQGQAFKALAKSSMERGV